ncbi:hypothetical protein Moror_8651 [Moniliophthora roreri MCA 2997]|uniref:Protein kinase domain-containing protein n=1 Tax=Moniliophthora roreri (strain MCA 2997) TaxID=1381753 RepID=V2XAQ9_MONRO|nr:hypothetical protein Moror_8651 [Moniliophthora roreri MCA 2997]
MPNMPNLIWWTQDTPCRLETSEDLRAFLELEPPEALNCLLYLDAASVPSVVQLLQSAVRSSKLSLDHYRIQQCFAALGVLAKKHRILPGSLSLNNITQEGIYPLAGGGFADIFKGNISGRPVCLKVLRVYSRDDQEKQDKVYADFCHEVFLCTQLNHRNVIPLLVINSDLFPAPSLCLVFPWMSNGDIVSFLERNPDHDRLKSTFQIASGLAYLHGRTPMVIHNDIKGSNILVDDHLNCRLADFGLAGVKSTSTITQWFNSAGGSTVAGSVRWMAPELFPELSLRTATGDAAGKDESARDIYAFACTVLEIMTGKPPFCGTLESAVMLQVVQGKRPARPTVGWCPDEMWSMVQLCWAQDPMERPSARKIEQYLRMLLSSRNSGYLSSDPSLRQSLSIYLDPRARSTNIFNPLSLRVDMKNIGKQLQCPNISDTTNVVMPAKPKKRALLIGVSGHLTGQESVNGDGILKGPHKDVTAMKNLLIEKYGYHPDDIIMLSETKHPNQKQPTRDNILIEMHNLIKDAVAGDRFVFHYTGFATQVRDQGSRKETGWNNCLVPCDSTGESDDDNLIKDDLVAILDSCHSATLLNLKHFRCNRVYVPWISKGRRQSDSLWNVNVRRQAALASIYQTEHDTDISRIPPQDFLAGLLDHPPSPTASYRESGLNSSESASPVVRGRDNYSDIGVESRTFGIDRQQFVGASPSIFNPESWLGGPIMSEPIEEFCDGFCRDLEMRTRIRMLQPEHGDVISLSACEDNQVAWDETSISQALVQLLREDPHPTFKDLMLKVSHTIHDGSLQMHQGTKAYKRARERWRLRKGRKRPPDGDTKGLEMNNFQDPQLSSDKPIDMGKRWDL